MGLSWGCGCPSLTDHARGLLTSLLTLLLLRLGSAQLTVEGPGQPVTATVGQDAAPFFHNAQPWMVALALVLVPLVVFIVVLVYLLRKKEAWIRELADQGAVEDEYRAKDEHQSSRLQELTEELVRKDKELKEQAAELVQKDKRLAELSSELEEKNVRLAHQSARLQELATELEKKDAKLKEQAAELAWRDFLLSHNRVKVTLDPRTAHPLLILSQDNCSVRWQSKWQQVQSAPERFDTRCCVLGCEEFREGRHCWEVEVEGEKGTYSGLAVGVAKASVKRKGEIKMSPEEGIWAVQYKEGQLTSLTSPPTHLSLSPVPTRLWACLDCTQGQVSFINPDNRVKIFTFTDIFLKGEGMRPWFWLGTNAQLYLRDNTLRPAADGGGY